MTNTHRALILMACSFIAGMGFIIGLANLLNWW